MSTNENNVVSTQELQESQKIITLGGLETFYNELKGNHFDNITNSINDINNVIEENEEIVASSLSDIDNRLIDLSTTVNNNNASVNDAIETLSKTVSDNKTELDNTITSLSETVSDNKTELDDKINIINGDGDGSIKKTVNDAIASVIDSAPETLDTLKEVAEYIAKDEQHAVEVTTTLSKHASDIQSLQDDNVIVKGDAEHSGVLKGEINMAGVTYKNEALNEGCVSLGAGTTAGLKGWYYKAVQIGNDSNIVYLYLTTEQQIPILVSTANAVENQEKDININISKGDICSIINGNRLIDCFEFRLNEISNYGRISFTYKGEGTNPLITIQNVEELKLEDYSVFCISKPSCGIVELSKCNIALGNNTKSLAESSVSIGLRSTAVGITSYAEGQDTIAVGECSHAEGAFTKSNGIASHTEGFGTQTEGLSAHAEGYNTLASGGASHSEGSATKATGLHSHAEGDTTEASGEQSHAEGKQTIAEGEHSHSEGYWTKAHGKSSHVEGQGLNNTTYSVASGDYSHSEGFYTRAFGTGSHTEGTYTIAYNKGEHAEGIYNKSTENVTLHSVGIGTSVNDRKNAHEITNDGKHYIIGIGGYDGTNPTSSKDLAALLSTADTDEDVDSVWNDIIK